MPHSFTPGPWNSLRNSSSGRFVIAAENAPVDICVLSNRDKSAVEIEANARLIAAAPELLEALTRLEFAAQCRDNTSGDPCGLLAVKAELSEAARQARAAITKATGNEA